MGFNVGLAKTVCYLYWSILRLCGNSSNSIGIKSNKYHKYKTQPSADFISSIIILGLCIIGIGLIDLLNLNNKFSPFLTISIWVIVIFVVLLAHVTIKNNLNHFKIEFSCYKPRRIAKMDFFIVSFIFFEIVCCCIALNRLSSGN